MRLPHPLPCPHTQDCNSAITVRCPGGMCCIGGSIGCTNDCGMTSGGSPAPKCCDKIVETCATPIVDSRLQGRECQAGSSCGSAGADPFYKPASATVYSG